MHDIIKDPIVLKVMKLVHFSKNLVGTQICLLLFKERKTINFNFIERRNTGTE